MPAAAPIPGRSARRSPRYTPAQPPVRAMQGADTGSAGELQGEGLRIGIVRARFNDAITSRLAQACLSELERLDVDDSDIRHVTVPGALEIPVALMAMAAS